VSAKARSIVGGILTVVGYATTGFYGVGYVLIIAGAALSYSGARQAQKEAERRARAGGRLDILRGNVRGSHEHHVIVAGRARIGGILGSAGNTDGPDMPNQNWHIAVEHGIVHAGGCGGLMSGFRLWVDDTVITEAQVSGDPNTGLRAVTHADYNGYMDIRHYLGTGTQTQDLDLETANIDAPNAYRRGIQWTHAKFKKPTDGDVFNKAFKFGFPTFTAEVSGWKCYDPRLDSTNGGSGSHRYTDPTTWAWSDNPILFTATLDIVRELDGGAGLDPATQVIWSSVAAAANVCDELISTPSGDQKRFRIGGVLSTSDPIGVNRQKALDACLGVRVPIGEKYAYHASVYRAPTVAITKNWLAGGYRIRSRDPLESVYNFVRVNFNDAAQDYKTIEAPAYVNATYETQDGSRRRPRDLNLPMVSDKWQAQYLSQIIGKRSRYQMTVELVMNLRALDMEVWETCTLAADTFKGIDLSSRVFRIEHIEPVVQNDDEGNPVDLFYVVLREDHSSIYTVETFYTPNTGSALTAGAETPPAPTNCQAFARPDGIRVSWEAGLYGRAFHLYRYIEIFRSTDNVNFTAINRVGRSANYYTDSSTVGGTPYYYKVRARGVEAYSAFSNTAGPTTSKQVGDGSGQLAFNLGFESGNVDWTIDGSRWSITNDPANAQNGSWCATFASNGTPTTDVIRNGKTHPVAPGDLVLVYGSLKSSAGADGTAYWRIAWLNSAGAEIGTSAGNAVTPATVYSQSRVTGVAPANTTACKIEVVGASISTGSWYADNGYITVTPKSQDEIPDGTVYGRPRQTALTSGEVDLSKSGVISRTADYISEAATRKWAAESGANITETRTSLDTTNVNGKLASTVKAETDAYLTSVGRVDISIDSATDPMPLWVRVVSITGGANGRGAYEVELTTGSGNAAVPATEKYFVSVDWTGYAAISKIGAGDSSTLTEVRVVGANPGGGVNASHFDAKFSISGATGVTAVVRPVGLVQGTFSVPMSKSPAAPGGSDIVTTLVYDTDTRDLAFIRNGGIVRLPVRGTALTSGEVDLSKAGVIQKSADYIAEAATRKWAAESGAQVFTGKSWTGLIDRTLGNIADDATYGRTKLTALTSGEVDLSKSGVLNRTGDYIAETGSRKWAGESGATVGAVWSTNLSGKPTPEQIFNNLMDGSIWVLGSTSNQTSPNGLFPDFNVNQSEGGENEIISGTGPHGRPMLLWDGHSVDGSGTGPDGGWNSGTFAIDPKKTYRFCQAFKFTGALGGTFYHGVGGSTVDDLGTETVNTNPYFQAVGSGTFTLDRWYLAVGYVHPYNHAGTTNLGAIYDMVTGATITGSTDYKWASSSTVSTNQRSYLYYSSNTSAHLHFAPPRVEAVDGNEPTILALLTDTAVITGKAVDLLADGATYGRTKLTALTSGEVDLSKSGVLNRTGDYIAETGTRKWAAESGAQVVTGKSLTLLTDRTLANVADTANRVALPQYAVPDAGAAAAWFKLGTWVATNQGDSMSLRMYTGTGYNSNAAQQTIVDLTVRLSNDNAAPNISGLSWYAGGGAAAVLAAKVVAVGGSTSASNKSWEIHVQLDAYSPGTYTVVLSPNNTWTHSGAGSSDPGAGSSTVVVGTGGRVFNAGATGVDALAEGVTYNRVKGTALTSGEVDLTKSGVLNRTADYISEAATRKWAAESGANITETRTAAAISGQGALATKNAADLATGEVTNKSADNITESGSRKWAGETGADVTAGKSVNVLEDVKTIAQFFTFTQTITATGAGSVTIPTGARLLVIRAWGGGGSGRNCGPDTNGGGGGGAGGTKKTVLLKSTDAGGTISYTVGTGATYPTTDSTNGSSGGQTTVTSSGLSFTNLNLAANGGLGGTSAAGGAGGSASGGDTNTSGSTGGYALNGGAGGASASIDGISGGAQEQPGGGGNGRAPNSGAGGSNGMVSFTWSG
jgi:hypothetical protein